MSYTPTTDFLALMRQTSSGVRAVEMPGLDFAVSAMARAGMFQLWVGLAAPTQNQNTTVWFKPATPSWTAEGMVFLWNAAINDYAPATPALWAAVLAPVTGYVFQSVATGADTVKQFTSLLAIQRTNPATTVLTLPSVSSRAAKSLQITDWSTLSGDHNIVLTPTGGDTIMKQNSWQLFSTVTQLSSVTLYPSTDLNGWVIAP